VAGEDYDPLRVAQLLRQLLKSRVQRCNGITVARAHFCLHLSDLSLAVSKHTWAAFADRSLHAAWKFFDR